MGKKRSSSKKKTANSMTAAEKAAYSDPDGFATFFKRCQEWLATYPFTNKEADKEKLRNALATYGNIYDNQKQ
jgi:hypothetical protein